MTIGDPVIWQGRPYFLRGLDPMSVRDRRAVLEDADTAEVVDAPFAEVEPARPNGAEKIA
jgi:hypothetical protein